MVGDGADAETITKFSRSPRFRRNVKNLSPTPDHALNDKDLEVRPRRKKDVIRKPKEIPVSQLGRVRRPDLERIEETPRVRSVFDISAKVDSPAWDRVRQVLEENYPAAKHLLTGLVFSSEGGVQIVTLHIKKDPRT